MSRSGPCVFALEDAAQLDAGTRHAAFHGVHGATRDARSGSYVDMLKAGIIDPTKVVRLALQGAASIAGLPLRNGERT
jgi:chaperonin GroEL (HSP60 family)